MVDRVVDDTRRFFDHRQDFWKDLLKVGNDLVIIHRFSSIHVDKEFIFEIEIFFEALFERFKIFEFMITDAFSGIFVRITRSNSFFGRSDLVVGGRFFEIVLIAMVWHQNMSAV